MSPPISSASGWLLVLHLTGIQKKVGRAEPHIEPSTSPTGMSSSLLVLMVQTLQRALHGRVACDNRCHTPIFYPKNNAFVHHMLGSRARRQHQ
eukprot:5463281-Pyramimonas_sp.AAC.2